MKGHTAEYTYWKRLRISITCQIFAIFCNGPWDAPKLPLPLGDPGLLVPPESIPPNGSSINSTIFVELTVVTDRHRPRNICNHRLHPMLCTAMQPNNHTYTHVNGPFSRTTRVSQYLRDKTSLNFTDAGNSEWQWHQLGHYASLHLALDR